MDTLIIILSLTVLLTHTSDSAILRNNALINKMISKFQEKGNPQSEEKREEKPAPEDVVSKMQSVLCRNFPSIPCEIIMNDDSLKSLIERSIQQLKYKKIKIEKTTVPPSFQLTLFPAINSEDISNFIQTSQYEHKNKADKKSKKKKEITKDEAKPSVYNGRNKLRKFYPHKIKHKDKKGYAYNSNNYSDEKSISVETAEPVNRRYTFRHPDSSVWRIDYMKHGEPSINMYGYEQDFKGKLIKTGPNSVIEDNYLDQAGRKDVLHPDVYIKHKYVRKNTANRHYS